MHGSGWSDREPDVGVAGARSLIATDVYARVLVGVDGSPASREAALQGGRLVAADGTLELATAESRPAFAENVAGARAESRLLNGPARDALLAEAERMQATLLVVGSRSRLSELAIGGVAGPLLHDARCSVLVARPPISDAAFPLSVVVGIDGSPGSLDALAAAEELRQRFATPLRVVLARHGDVDVVHAELRAPELELLDGRPVDVLVDAAARADLLVVGSRGLRGLRTFGSVSERVAHKARSSVLVVRDPRWPERTAVP